MTSTGTRPHREFRESGFFVLRTPLLPVEELEAWSTMLEAPKASEGEWQELARAVENDRLVMIAALHKLLTRPEIREALFIASPSLWAELERSLEKGSGEEAPAFESRHASALLRYFFRMATRATPFGLFSGCSLGAVKKAERGLRVRLVPRSLYQRRTRLDAEYLTTLTATLAEVHGVRDLLSYHPNSSLYSIGGHLRYAEARTQDRRRAYYLVGLERTEHIEQVLLRASSGAQLTELVGAVLSFDADLNEEDAQDFIHGLIAAQVLVPTLQAAITGCPALEGLLSQLRSVDAGNVAEVLEETRASLERLDSGGMGQPCQAYRQIKDRVTAELPGEIDASHSFQVDLYKPVEEAVLGGNVVRTLLDGVGMLHRFGGAKKNVELEVFCRDFESRYGTGSSVPLVEALDAESGIPFPSGQQGTKEPSPLLAGLRFRHASADKPSWSRRDDFLLEHLLKAVAKGETVIELRSEDLKSIDTGEILPLPDSFSVLAEVAAASQESLARGEFQVFLRSAAGPPGVRLLGRFCHLAEELSRQVKAHIDDEEALRPDEVFAEIVHLPQGRLGNILSRPTLRRYEIPYLGPSSVDASCRIPVNDLDVSVSKGRVVLTSRRLGRIVNPRLTAAHNYTLESLPIYRFLGLLQSQGEAGSLTWSWGQLTSAPYLPRVVFGKVVLSRARWRVSSEELKRLAREHGAHLLMAVRKWREQRGVPRRALLVEREQELFFDFENVLCIDGFLDLARRSSGVVLEEVFPSFEELPVEGPEGRFVHQIIVPFTRVEAVSSYRPSRGAEASPHFGRQGRFAPGSEWLTAKIYCGTSVADAVLMEAVAAVVQRAMADGAADGWYFLRYFDPDPHLRVRFHGVPSRLLSEVMPDLHRMLSDFLSDGRVWCLQLDTYQQEVDRYGGAVGIELAERLFQADSEAVLGILRAISAEQLETERWCFALRGVDLLLTNLGIERGAKLALASHLREGYAAESEADVQLKRDVGQLFRVERDRIARFLSPQPLGVPGVEEAFGRRSQQIRRISRELRRHEKGGSFLQSLQQLAASYVHMHLNRLLRADLRKHELVLYDFLYRHYAALKGRRDRET